MQKNIIGIITVLIAIAGSYYLGYINNVQVPETIYIDQTEEVTDTVFLEVLDELMANHYSQPDEQQLMQGAIDGMIESLDDPHTTYFDAEEYSQYQSNFGESYVGIGVTVSFMDNLVVVEEVKSGGPADGAGIRPNDIIAFVDGVDVRNDAFYAIISTIIGDEGTDVTIGIIRSGFAEPIYLTMTRAVIDNSSVTYETFTSGVDKIGYIKVTTFGDETFTKFREAINALEDQNITAMIVDLRNNGGGHLNTVYNMMNQFLLKNDEPMFSTEYYSGGEFFTQEYFATNNTKRDYNILTLVNGNSASASEVFSSAMQEHGGYPVLGTVTFGKGTMQTDKPIIATVSDSIHITIGKWITSDGNWVHYNGGTEGVTPDVIVEPSIYELAYKLFLFNDEVLEFDQVDPRIKNVQLILNTMGYTVRTDGYFDTETLAAINDIQTINTLTVNGTINSQTLVVINEALDTYQNDYTNDTQLQEAITYLVAHPLDD